jgi:hypothetical protein
MGMAIYTLKRRLAILKKSSDSFSNEETTFFNPADYYNKLFETSQDYWKKNYDEWQKLVQSAEQHSGITGNFDFNPADFYKNMTSAAQDFWKKADESKNTYTALLDLWRQLAEKSTTLDNKGITEVYEKWNRQFADLFRDSMTPDVPGYVKDFNEKWMDCFKTSGETMMDNAKAWTSSFEEFQKAAQRAQAGGPNSVIEFMEALKKNYEETFGQMARHPMFGKDMEFWRRHRDSFDRFVKYNIAASGFYTAMYDVISDSTRRVIEEYAAMSARGDQFKSFEEFYKYWSKQVSATYDKALFTEQYCRLAGNMVDEMSRFKMAYDELIESYLANQPIAKKSDMNALYKTVYELKKELRSLKKEMKNNEKRGD